MRNWFSSSTEFDISLLEPPLYNKYTPVNPNVRGVATIRFKDHLKKVSEIRCGILGSAYIVYHYKETRQVNGKTQVNRREITQTHNFFNRYYNIPLSSQNIDAEHTNEVCYAFTPGESIEYPFNLQIPNELYLPSTCNEFGNRTATISINYNVYAEVYKYGSILTSRTKMHSSLRVPIIYQAAMNRVLRQPMEVQLLPYEKSEVFKNKVKKFYFDEKINALVPSAITKPHSKTRFIRQIWNDNYREETYLKITKSIPLKVSMLVASAFDMNEPLYTQWLLGIFPDLASIGIASNDTTDFVFNGQSTNLGLFKIESLKIEALNTLHLQCKHHQMTDEIKYSILEIEFKDVFFDIKDFTFNSDFNSYAYKVPPELLTKNANIDITQTLNQLMGEETIKTSGFVPDWYSNKASFVFTWELSDSESQKVHYKFVTASAPDVLFDEVDAGTYNTNNNTDYIYNPGPDETESDQPPPSYESHIDNEKDWDEKK